MNSVFRKILFWFAEICLMLSCNVYMFVRVIFSINPSELITFKFYHFPTEDSDLVVAWTTSSQFCSIMTCWNALRICVFKSCRSVTLVWYIWSLTKSCDLKTHILSATEHVTMELLERNGILSGCCPFH